MQFGLEASLLIGDCFLTAFGCCAVASITHNREPTFVSAKKTEAASKQIDTAAQTNETAANKTNSGWY